MVTALLDACVLYPAPLRDFLVRLASSGAFIPRWSGAIHEEWISSVLGDRPDLSRSKLERTRDLMNAVSQDSLVEGYEHLISALSLPDPDDAHVLAAAIVARADVIVTFNLADFPKNILGAFGLVAEHPDRFVIRLLDEEPSLVVDAFNRQRVALRNPPHAALELLDTLERQNLRGSVSRIRSLLVPIDYEALRAN